MTRGYACIGLYNPKFDVNIGSVLRAAQCFEASMVVLGGARNNYSKAVTDTMNAYRHIPLMRIENMKEAVPYDCVPVAVEINDKAKNLSSYDHPQRAFYVFGPEDGDVPNKVQGWCRDTIYIPTKRCLNLAATVNIVLYDRLAKGV